LDNINGNRNIKVENDLKYLNKKNVSTDATAAASSEMQFKESSANNDNNNDEDLIRQRRMNRFQSQE
jgi:hypothetical protein